MREFSDDKKEHIKEFQNICVNSKIYDESGERDWFDLAYGFFIGKEYGPQTSFQLAMHVYYDKQLWQ